MDSRRREAPPRCTAGSSLHLRCQSEEACFVPQSRTQAKISGWRRRALVGRTALRLQGKLFSPTFSLPFFIQCPLVAESSRMADIEWGLKHSSGSKDSNLKLGDICLMPAHHPQTSHYLSLDNLSASLIQASLHPNSNETLRNLVRPAPPKRRVCPENHIGHRSQDTAGSRTSEQVNQFRQSLC